MWGIHNGESLRAPLLSPQLWFVPPVSQDPDALLPLLSHQERCWGQALPPLRQRQYWRSRAAMRSLLGKLLAVAPHELPLHSPPGAPPQLALSYGTVSLSHANGAMLIGWSPEPIGVDLEPAARSFDARGLMQRFFALREQRQLIDLPAEPLRQAVLRSWLVKEAAIKWRHRTLAEELTAWVFDHQAGVLERAGDGLQLHPLEGRIEAWRWAAVGDGLQPSVSAPLTWRFECG